MEWTKYMHLMGYCSCFMLFIVEFDDNMQQKQFDLF